MTAVPSPVLEYRWWRDRPSGEDIVGDGPPLYDVIEASARKDGRALVVWVRGRLLRRDGQVSRVQRSVEVDARYPQPDWLSDVIEDAVSRLIRPPRPGRREDDTS